MFDTDGTHMAFEDRCAPCDRDFLSESALSQHLAQVHGSDDAREFSGKERKKAASSGAALKDGSFPIKTVQDLKNAIAAYGRAKDKAKAKAHIIARAKALGATNLLPDGWVSDKAELMHSCKPCDRTFVGERSLFQHATAVHGYNEAADRAFAVGDLGQTPWTDGDRQVVIQDRAGVRILRDASEEEDVASHQFNPHGSSSTVSGLACGACDRSFLSVRALSDHAEAVHDSALEATYNERLELVSSGLRKALNSGSPYGRVYSWVVDMTDQNVVFQIEGEEFYRQAAYSLDDDGNATIGESTQVRRRTVYETVGSTS